MFDRHGRRVGQRRERVEIRGVELRALRAVHIEHTDDVLATPERRTHERADVEAQNAVRHAETGIGRGVNGEDGHAIAHHLPHDHAAERRLRRHGPVAVAEHARDQALVGGLAQHQERTLGRNGAERHLDNLVQHIGQRLRREQRAVHIGEQTDEMTLADRALADRGRDGPHDRAWTVGNLVVLGEQVLLGDRLLEHEHDFAKPDRGADLDADLLMNGRALEKRAETASGIRKTALRVDHAQRRVVARHTRVGEHEVRRGQTANDRHALLQAVCLRNTLLFIAKLEHGSSSLLEGTRMLDLEAGSGRDRLKDLPPAGVAEPRDEKRGSRLQREPMAGRREQAARQVHVAWRCSQHGAPLRILRPCVVRVREIGVRNRHERGAALAANHGHPTGAEVQDARLLFGLRAHDDQQAHVLEVQRRIEGAATTSAAPGRRVCAARRCGRRSGRSSG